ncbi:hypothetical protein K458DRAFT_410302 [Lentithecium fluviatile CBS 122367]|uniref:Uncharacterized protein n=1 Tax=Lentithecium fluviatile CBS 122367 TaxID=1168545 RepID=A0A6G1IF50_9PLEO|nr:hypothetical protein K458DRAFT_410302 [Lentithecium fluviatile CBS 122367]
MTFSFYTSLVTMDAVYPTISWKTEWNTLPPDSCSSIRWLPKSSSGFWGGTCDGTTGLGDCYPWPDGSAAYSPATACPSGWTSYHINHHGSRGLKEDEVAFKCCPSGFAARYGVEAPGQDWNTYCLPVKLPRGTQTFPLTYCGTTTGPASTAITFSDDLSLVLAWGIQMRYRSSDLTTPAPTATRATSGDTGSPTGGTSSDKTNLPSEAKIAIGVIVPITVLIGIALLVWILVRHKKRQQHTLSPEEVQEEYGKAELDAGGSKLSAGGAVKEKAELDGGGTGQEVPSVEGEKSKADEVAVAPVELGDTSPNTQVIELSSSTCQKPGGTDSARAGPGTEQGQSMNGRTPVELATGPEMTERSPENKRSGIAPDHGIAECSTHTTVGVSGRNTQYSSERPIDVSADQFAAVSIPTEHPTITPTPASPTISKISTKERLRQLRERQMQIAKEKVELERLRKLKDEEQRLEKEIARLESKNRSPT